MLSEEEVAVVEGGGVDFYEEIIWAWAGFRDVFNCQPGQVIIRSEVWKLD